MISKKTIAVFNIRTFSLLLLGFILALYASWMVSASVGYGYSWWYGFYESKQHIAHYAPQNRHRQGFETTSVAEHKQFFQQIVDSVHDDGKGLEEIHYSYAGNEIPLLHSAEVIHLQDVANLINQIHYLALCLAVVFIWLCYRQLVCLKRDGNLIQGRSQLLIVTALAGIVLFVFLIFGAKAIFYQMHVLIFPPDHQWFFYYQDSLMSTMMKAPDLFAGIALQILLPGISLFALGVMLYRYAVKQFIKG
ncbi:hypothetical protein A9R00_08670 [Oleispira antarctica]|uniref:DUF1461 domain-containing protein n=1 Tax=Oleispira antarctica TaxID=188908 RepID=A0A1Y5HYP0_OLEAN|nr:hypothetical protein A9R00_08670 [Oleispira antarctica]